MLRVDDDVAAAYAKDMAAASSAFAKLYLRSRSPQHVIYAGGKQSN